MRGSKSVGKAQRQRVDRVFSVFHVFPILCVLLLGSDAGPRRAERYCSFSGIARTRARI